MITLPALPQVHVPRTEREGRGRPWRSVDPWLVTTIGLSVIAAMLAWWLAQSAHLTLLTSASHAYLRVARQTFDSATPGLAQLGSTRLPLFPILMQLFIWNDTLWRSGIAGSILTVPAFVTTSAMIFLTARRLTGDSAASFAGTLAFTLNPNMLYLQTIPQPDMLVLAAGAATAYAFVLWAEDDAPQYLVSAATATAIASVTGYAGWFLCLLVAGGILLVGIARRLRPARIFANLFLYLFLGASGMILWIVWNMVIFGDPIYFLRNNHTLLTPTKALVAAHLAPAYLQPLEALRTLLALALDLAGPLVLALAAVGLVLGMLRAGNARRFLTIAFLVSPILMLGVAICLGFLVIWAPGATPALATAPSLNLDAGATMIVSIAIFLALLVRRLPLGALFLGVVVLAQSAWLFAGGVPTLQDARLGAACYRPSPVVTYLATHYDGGRVLHDADSTGLDLALANVDPHQVIQPGSGNLYALAIAHPATTVHWVIIRPPIDAISQQLNLASPVFATQFTLVASDPTRNLSLYYVGDPSTLPNHPPASDPQADYQGCTAYLPGT